MDASREVYVEFYDYLNLGDDLLFFVLAQRYPHVRFSYIAHHSTPETFPLPNVRRIRRVPYIDGVLRRLRIPFRLNQTYREWIIRRSRHAVRLGGSLYMEKGEWRENVHRDRTLLACPGGAVFINGNFGPWQTQEFLETYVALFSEARDVTVRDESSLTQLAAVPGIRMAPDLIFTMSSTPDAAERGGVVVSLIDLDGRAGLSQHRHGYERAMAELVDDLAANGHHVTLMSFCATEGDEAAVERVNSLIAQEARASVTTYLYRGDIDAALTVLRKAEAVVATRFHAMVLGLAFGCRVSCVEYSDKVANVLRDLGLGDLGWSIEEFVGASRAERYRRATTLEASPPGDLARRADEHFAVLDRMLSS
ncbi:MAG: polysaccharide pyruvyl transferase family protein [Micropruina sp.]|uniref:polysaccharide pyruvyl transferase family protein n=1 Tax=Micropruina sp. TaxID=2737536 RepID=UPI0039E6F9BB